MSLTDQTEPIDEQELLRIRDAMAARGPDAQGHWVSPDGLVGLGHRRLSIIDLFPSSNQPMSWASGRYWIIFNGEIYNYRALRQELEQRGVQFRSQGDTEVILALYAHYGPAMLARLRGMFALAIWDEEQKELFLARDPFGIKPLYYVQDGRYLRFASQVKALKRSNAAINEPEPAGVVGFLLWGSVPEPYTLWRGVRALPAGHYLVLRRNTLPEVISFLKPGGWITSRGGGITEALESSVRAHLVADVPMAVFLSAGLDSTLVATLAARQASQPILTITVRFASLLNTPWDEGPIASETAQRLGTRHVERVIDVHDFPDLWREVLRAMDQPSIDGFNTYVISKIAHEVGVKVVLSGLGGDELFGSYPSFRRVPQWARRVMWLRRVPGALSLWPTIARALFPQQPKAAGMLHLGARLPGAYYLLRGLYLPEEIPSLIDPELAKAGLDVYDPVTHTAKCLQGCWFAESDSQDASAKEPWFLVQRMEALQYMKNQLLRDADWASMAHSLELRVPLVDVWLWQELAAHRFEPARSHGKAAVVRAVVRDLAPAVFQRPKSGFVIPTMDWIDSDRDRKEPRRWGRDSRQIALRVLHEFLPQLRP